MKKNEEFYLHSYIYQELTKKVKKGLYRYEWTTNRSNSSEINTKLQKATKNAKKLSNKGKGMPDLIYFNDETKLLILTELKKDVRLHTSNNLGKIKNPKKFAVDGVLHYSSFFKEYNVFSIAISGEFNNYLIDQYFKPSGEINQKHIPAKRILNESDYENIIIDNSTQGRINDLSQVLDKINELMNREKIETSKRTIILGAIIFSLTHFSQIKTDIEKIGVDTDDIVSALTRSIERKMKKVLPLNKRTSNSKIIKRFCNLISSYTMNEKVWKQIISKVAEQLMPIINKMKKTTYHDFSGDMYRVLLRYTAGDGKVLGQILTPKHVANLMIDLIELKRGDSVIDPACGTGIFLVNSMNRLISFARNEKEINEIKSQKIFGIEISLEMFFLTLVNMLINDDGKTNIYVDDDNPNVQKRGIFKYNSNDFSNKEVPKKVLMNPPYLTHNEMWEFIMKSLELATEKACIIIPTAILNNNRFNKNQFLKKHSLLGVFNMPNDIFQNKGSSGASIKTSIIVIEINKPNINNHLGTYLYDLKSDGFISSKKYGRYDGNNYWNQIKDKLLNSYHNREVLRNTACVIKQIKPEDSWHFNYFNKINLEDFNNINNYLLDYIDTLLKKEIKSNLEIAKKKASLFKKIIVKELDFKSIYLFPANEILDIETKFKRAYRIEKYDDSHGQISYVAAANHQNGSRLLNTRNIYDETVLKDKFSWNSQGDGGAGLAFFHPYNFIAASTVMIFSLKEKYKNLPLYRKIFLAYSMGLEKKNRYHGNSITQKQFVNGTLKIALPSNGKDINWLKIDDFMKNNDLYKIIESIVLNNSKISISKNKYM